MRSEDARLVTETLVAADLRGVRTHGVAQVARYVDRILHRGIDPKGTPSVVRDAGASLLVDGGNNLGQIGSVFAMKQAIDRAGSTGIAAAGLRNSNHCGALAYYARMALERDCIGIAISHALPSMAPWGGAQALIGNNPLCVAVPGESEPPVVMDTSFSRTFPLKMMREATPGEPIPDTWAFDSEGRPTTDLDTALAGLLQPVGEYRGTGLALVMGVLASVLTGASFGTELGNMKDGPRAGGDGQFFIAIGVEAFAEVGAFKARMDGIVRQLRESRPAAGVDRVYVPGERAADAESRHLAEGIPVDDTTLEALATTAREVGVSFDVA
jgi:LDH2 family malate/lactate/ureidoglycolate dehydrogenase